jgi:hypothetical protein
MKRFSLCFVLLFALAACTGRDLPSIPPPSETDGMFPPDPSPPAVVQTAEGNFPQTGHPVIDAFYNAVRGDFERLAEILAEEGQSYHLIADYSKEYDADGILSFSRFRYLDMGGAHGMTDVFCETFCADTGRLLTLDDFFTAGRDVYLPRLLEFIYAFIDRNPDEFWADSKQIAAEIFPFDTFVVTEGGLALLFPEYNIAPFSTGLVRVDIPREDVADIISRMPLGS